MKNRLKVDGRGERGYGRRERAGGRGGRGEEGRRDSVLEGGGRRMELKESLMIRDD